MHDHELNTIYLIGWGQVARTETMEREHRKRKRHVTEEEVKIENMK